MKHTILTLFVILSLLYSGCEHVKEPHRFTFSGKAQKGPYVAGTNVILNELNSDLGQTGKAFTTTILTDDGSFGLNSIEMTSSLSLITANGFYFSELYGELSGAALSLQAIADLTAKTSVNINVMTHLIKGRIEHLVAGGLSFSQATLQAKSELLSFLGVNEPFDRDFEDLDITEDSEQDAVLLSTSILLQRYTTIWNERASLTAELTYMLARLGGDFSDDGEISNRELIDTLLYNISMLELLDIRDHMEARYDELGISATLPGFEKYINVFQEKHSDYLYTEFTYPDSAIVEPMFPDYPAVRNILVPGDTLFKAGQPYSIAAFIPLNSNLTIKFIGDNSNYNYTISMMSGWQLINEYPQGFVLNSQRSNNLMTMLFYLENPGSATIEYYENGSQTPIFTKQIRWEQTELI